MKSTREFGEVELTLVDKFDFDKKTDRHVEYIMRSFNMVAWGYGKRWSNGWCPINHIFERDGKYFGKISTELVPKDIYNGCVVRLRVCIKE